MAAIDQQHPNPNPNPNPNQRWPGVLAGPDGVQLAAGGSVLLKLTLTPTPTLCFPLTLSLSLSLTLIRWSSRPTACVTCGVRSVSASTRSAASPSCRRASAPRLRAGRVELGVCTLQLSSKNGVGICCRIGC